MTTYPTDTDTDDPADRLADDILKFLRGGPMPVPPTAARHPTLADDDTPVVSASAG